MVGYSNDLGSIHYSEEVLAKIVGFSTMECYGVVGMASQKFLKDGIAELLKKENYAKGVVVRKKEDALELDVYIVVSFGVKISEVVHEVQTRIKYVLEKSLELEFKKVNVYVQDVKVMK